MKITLPEPAGQNDFLADHVEMLCRCHERWTGHALVEPGLSRVARARYLYTAPFAVLSHDTRADPVFNYANLTAQALFEMDWFTFTTLPSRRSAEPVEQDARQRLLDQVGSKGYIDDYRGVRISRTGKKFWIENATVWTLIDSGGNPSGQAAAFARWQAAG